MLILKSNVNFIIYRYNINEYVPIIVHSTYQMIIALPHKYNSKKLHA